MSIQVRCGRLETGGDLVLDFGVATHVALQGQTRYGKSAFTYANLAALAPRDDLLVVGTDPTGVLLNAWRDHPGQEWRAIGGKDMEAHATVMESICGEMDRRIAWLVANDRDKVPPPTSTMPILLVVMEEYPSTLSLAESEDAREGRKANQRVAVRIRNCFLRLAQESAKAGIRLFCIAQRYDAAIISGAARGQFATCITMRVDRRDAVEMLHPMATPERVEQVTRMLPGVGVIEMPGRPLTMFKGDLIEYDDYSFAVRHWGRVKQHWLAMSRSGGTS